MSDVYTHTHGFEFYENINLFQPFNFNNLGLGATMSRCLLLAVVIRVQEPQVLAFMQAVMAAWCR